MFENFIRYRARAQPDSIALETPQGKISYGRLDADIKRVAAALAEWKLPPRSRVLVSDSRPYVHWLIIHALERSGHISVSDDAADQTFAVVHPDAIIAETDAKAGRLDRFLQTSAAWVQETLSQPVPSLPDIDRGPDDPIRIVLSSGTTGLPKQLVLLRKHIDRRVFHGLAAQIPSTPRMLSMMGVNVIGGYISTMAVFVAGGTMLFGGPVPPPEALVALRPDFMLIAPIQLQYLLAGLPAGFAPRHDLAIVLAGSAAPRRLCQEASRRLTQNLNVGYGSTEAGFITCGPASNVERHPGSAGYCMPWAKIEIVDADDNPLPAGMIGIVRTSSDEMMDIYVGGGSGDGQFRNGWFYPGDLGSIAADGLFIIEGRDDDVLNLGGVKLAAWTVEELLLSVPEVTEAAAFTLAGPDGIDALCAAVVVSPGSSTDALRELLRVRLNQHAKLFAVDRIPRNQMGKVLRTELKASLKGTPPTS